MLCDCNKTVLKKCDNIKFMLYLFICLTVMWFIFMTYLSHEDGEHNKKTSLRLARHFEFLGDDVEEINRYLRKIAHIVVFAVFAILYCITVRLAELPLWTMSLVYVFTIVDEATKPLIKGRHFNIYDVVLNVAGTTIGVLVVMII